jgi:hypothetical protein
MLSEWISWYVLASIWVLLKSFFFLIIMLKFLFYCILLCCRKYIYYSTVMLIFLLTLFFKTFHPRMIQNLAGCQSLLRFFFENSRKQWKSFLWSLFCALLEIRFTLYNLFVKLTHISSLKWNSSIEHCV